MGENQNVLVSFFNAASDRISGQVTGSFILAWLLINWRIPIELIYGKAEPENRINALISHYQNGTACTVGSLFIFPVVATFLYLITVPRLREFYFRYIQKIETRSELKRRLDQQEIEQAAQYDSTTKAILTSIVTEQRTDIGTLQAAGVKLNALIQSPTPAAFPDALSLVYGEVKAVLERLSDRDEELKIFFGTPIGLSDLSKVLKRNTEAANRINKR